MADLPARSDDHLDEAVVAWLCEDGRDWVDRAVTEAPTDPLTRVEWLRGQGLVPERAALVAEATAAQTRLAPDLAAAGWERTDVLLTTAAAEQASHPLVAAHRAARFAAGGADLVVDLACGAGMDAAAIARTGPEVIGIDLDGGRLRLAAHNVAVAGGAFTARRQDALSTEAVEAAPHAPWHADPGRRTDGRRSRTLAETQPPSGELARAHQGRPGGALVTSPAVALDDPELPDGELEFIQVGGRLVEAVVWIGDLATPGVIATATRLEPGADGWTTQSLQRRDPPAARPVGQLAGWLLVPDPAVTRARLHHELALEAGAVFLADDRALCTGNRPPDDGWWTPWEVEAELPGRPRGLARSLRGLDELPISIETHGPVGSLDPWWRALTGVPRGPIGRRLHLVATGGTVRCIVTRHPSLSGVSAGG